MSLETFMMGDSTEGEKEDISKEDARDNEHLKDTRHGEGKENSNEKDIEKVDDDDDMKREGDDIGGENVGDENADSREVNEKTESTGEDEREMNKEYDERDDDVSNMKRENDCKLDEDSRENGDEQHEESVEALSHHDNVNEDDSIDIVSEVNKEAQFIGENEKGNDEENVGQMEGDHEAGILDNDDDDVGDSISVNGSPRDAGRYENDDSYKNTDLTAIEKTGDKETESKEGNRRSSMKSAKSTKKSKTVRVKSSKTVSSIEVDMTRIIRNEDDNDFDADEDDDAVTRVTCGKSVDFSIPVDEVDEELQRVIDRPGSGRTSMMDNEDMIGLGRAATMNTPVTIDDRER